ncbi:MAG: XdhC family protein, partial [Clostridiales bacterium]|nr:XdhC family protein [Clostridiales bacterium]
MTELYRLLQEKDSNQQNVILTLLEESAANDKALISEEEMVWCSRNDGFLAAHAAELTGLTESGIVEIEGRRIYCEPVGHEKRLVICGGGHVSMPVIQIGRMMGFYTVVLEDRPKFADNARRAGADEVICEPFEEGLDRIEGSRDTFFVIVTRGHRHDQVCLHKIAAKEHAYIGMIGSRRRTALVRQSLAEQGVDKTVLDRVYTPIGLDIGAETPAEIAIAIMAEIIEVKNRRMRVGGYSKELVKAILDEEKSHIGKTLVTIVGRKGSAPREVGT